MILEVPVRPVSLNAERSGNHQKRHRITNATKSAAQAVATEAIAALRPRRQTPVFARVRIEVEPFAINRRYRQDIANCYPSVKACIDGFVCAGLIDDDDDTHLAFLGFHPHQFGRDALVFTITEVT